MVEKDLLFIGPFYNGNTALIFLYDMRVLLHQKPILIFFKERLEVVERLHGSSSNDGESTSIDYLGELFTLKAEDLNGYSFGILPLKQ